MGIVNSTEVRDRLSLRWPDSRFLHVYEAPIDSQRLGRKADALILSLWKSDRWEIDCVEVKVSYSDWRREIESVRWRIMSPDGLVLAKLGVAPSKTRAAYEARRAGIPEDQVITERYTVPDTSKSEEWRHRSHRFWVAAPHALAERIAADVAERRLGWGVLGIPDEPEGAPVVLAKPVKNTAPKALGYGTWLGIVRAAADSGANALARAYDSGFLDGKRGQYRRAS